MIRSRFRQILWSPTRSSRCPATAENGRIRAAFVARRAGNLFRIREEPQAGITRSKGTTRTTSRSPLSRSLQSEFSNVWWAWIGRLLPSRREGGRIHLPSQNCFWPWRKSKNWAAARKSHSYYAWSTWGEESNWTRRAGAPRKNVRFRSNWSSDRFQGSPGSPRVSRWRATASRLVSVFMAALYISLDLLLIPCKLQLF